MSQAVPASGVILRRATVKDGPGLRSLFHENYGKTYGTGQIFEPGCLERLIHSPETLVVVATDHQGEIIGSVGLDWLPLPDVNDVSAIRRLIVAKSHRRRGIASLLSAHVQKQASHRGQLFLSICQTENLGTQTIRFRNQALGVGILPDWTRIRGGRSFVLLCTLNSLAKKSIRERRFFHCDPQVIHLAKAISIEWGLPEPQAISTHTLNEPEVVQCLAMSLAEGLGSEPWRPVVNKSEEQNGQIEGRWLPVQKRMEWVQLTRGCGSMAGLVSQGIEWARHRGAAVIHMTLPTPSPMAEILGQQGFLPWALIPNFLGPKPNSDRVIWGLLLARSANMVAIRVHPRLKPILAPILSKL